MSNKKMMVDSFEYFYYVGLVLVMSLFISGGIEKVSLFRRRWP